MFEYNKSAIIKKQMITIHAATKENIYISFMYNINPSTVIKTAIMYQNSIGVIFTLLVLDTNKYFLVSNNALD